VSLQGEDSFLDSLPEPYRRAAWETLSIRAKDADAYIAVSRYFGDMMSKRLDLPPERMHVVRNGISLDGYRPASLPPDPPALGYLARMCPVKGLADLVEAFIILKRGSAHRRLRLRVAGARTPSDEPYVRKIQRRLRSVGLIDEVDFLPNIDRENKLEFLRSLSVFSVPAKYDEAFGLYVLESLASGVPVVEPRRGALPELLEATGGGILCEPDSPESLADAIGSLLSDPERARALAEQGRKAVLKEFSADRMAKGVERILQTLCRCS
jgi:glycosyltransferase involved in cell wall biosynthesis